MGTRTGLSASCGSTRAGSRRKSPSSGSDLAKVIGVVVDFVVVVVVVAALF
jgi:hypothetical protein